MTYRLGASGADISALQRALAAAGFGPGAIDGDFGPRTYKAVEAFQRAHGLAVDGIVGPRTLQALGLGKLAELPAWLEVAFREESAHIAEIPGPEDNQRILGYFRATALQPSHDEIAWCAAFVGWCLGQAHLKGSGSAAARSYLTWGEHLEQPRLGCVVVFRRDPNPAQGHANFFIREEGAYIRGIGGNQRDQVCEALYPRARVLGYRWPSD